MLVKLSRGLRSKAARVNLQTLPWFVKQKEWRLIVREMSGVRWVSRITKSQQAVPLFPNPNAFQATLSALFFLSSAKEVSPLCQNPHREDRRSMNGKWEAFVSFKGCWRSDSQRWGFTWCKCKGFSPHHTYQRLNDKAAKTWIAKKSCTVFFYERGDVIVRINYMNIHKGLGKMYLTSFGISFCPVNVVVYNKSPSDNGTNVCACAGCGHSQFWAGSYKSLWLK